MFVGVMDSWRRSIARGILEVTGLTGGSAVRVTDAPLMPHPSALTGDSDRSSGPLSVSGLRDGSVAFMEMQWGNGNEAAKAIGLECPWLW